MLVGLALLTTLSSELGIFFLSGVQLALVALITAIRLWALQRCKTYRAATPVGQNYEPRVCIQIATYSEPPQLVIETLESLGRLNYSNYEVLVVDNNTPDPALYEPVERYCRHHGFKFVHFDFVEGAKAGALNKAHGYLDDDTDYIMVLDADYTANADILSVGMAHFTDSSVALVQFPQSYRNGASACPLALEYASFFNVYMTTAQQVNSVLATGTAAIVSRRALEEIGGWPTSTITEDADLGLHLHARGYRGTYVHKPAAAGLMPYCLDAFLKQRRRWILGNLQCLKMHSLEHLSKEGKVSAFCQLTAWLNPLLLLPILSLALTFMQVNGKEFDIFLASGVMLNAAVLIYLGGSMLFFFQAAEDSPKNSRVGAFFVHWATFWTALSASLAALKDKDFVFVRTSKVKVTETLQPWDLVLTGVPLTLSLTCLCSGSVALSSAWLTLSLPGFCRMYLKSIFKIIRKRSY